MNEHVRDKFITRAKIINYVRKFLDNLGFLEVSLHLYNVSLTPFYFGTTTTILALLLLFWHYYYYFGTHRHQ